MTPFKRFTSSFTTSTPNAIILAALILGVSHVIYGLVIAPKTPAAVVTYFTGKPIDTTDHIEGDSTSDVVVIEYSDPECPFCIQFHPTMKQIRNDYGNKVGFIYRHFPLVDKHPHAFNESKAIFCAGTIGGNAKFFAYIDALYGYKFPKQTATDPSPQLPATGKEDIARGLSIDPSLFAACMGNDNTSIAVDASVNDGVQAGVQGTPSTFVLKKTSKGYEVIALVDGARPREYLQAAIDEALSR